MKPGLKEQLQQATSLEEAKLILNEAFRAGIPEKSMRRLKRIYSQLPFTKESK